MCKGLGYKAGMTQEQFEAMQKFEQKVPIEVITKTGTKKNPTLQLNTEIEEEL